MRGSNMFAGVPAQVRGEIIFYRTPNLTGTPVNFSDKAPLAQGVNFETV